MNIKASGKTNNVRKYTGGGARPDLREIKAKEAKERAEAWAKLSPKEQLAELDRRLGKGIGAAKQRARLQAKINAPPPPKAKKDAEVEAPAKETRTKAKDRRAQEKAERPSK